MPAQQEQRTIATVNTDRDIDRPRPRQGREALRPVPGPNIMTQQQALLPASAEINNQDLPAAAEGLCPTDLQRSRQSLDSSVSQNTRASYRSAWKTFEQWAQARAALAMPASPALNAAYLSHLAEERHLSVATVRLHRAATAAIHKAQGHQAPTDNEGVRRVLKGIARAHGRAAKQAKPLTAGAPAAVRAIAPTRRPLADAKKQESAERASWRARLDLALLSVLRDGLLALRGRGAHLGRCGAARQWDRPNQRPAVQDLPRGLGRNPLHWGPSPARPSRTSDQPRSCWTDTPGLRAITPPDRTESARRGKGRRPWRGVHPTQRPCEHGPGPDENRRRASSIDDRGPVEGLENDGVVHPRVKLGPGPCGQVLPREEKSDNHLT